MNYLRTKPFWDDSQYDNGCPIKTASFELCKSTTEMEKT